MGYVSGSATLEIHADETYVEKCRNGNKSRLSPPAQPNLVMQKEVEHRIFEASDGL